MNTPATLKVLSFIGKIAGLAAGASAYAGMIPEKFALIGLFVFGGASILKDTVNRVGDLIDDGKENNSFGR